MLSLWFLTLFRFLGALAPLQERILWLTLFVYFLGCGGLFVSAAAGYS